MKLLTIKPNVLQDLFSYLKNKRKFKIIKYNISLHKKLNISNDDYIKNYFSKINYKHIIIFILKLIGINFKMILKELLIKIHIIYF